MKTLGYVLCFLLGLLAGWGLAERLPEPTPPPPPPIPAPPSSKETELRQALDRARADLVSAQKEKEALENELRTARSRTVPDPEPRAAAPGPGTLPPGWLERLKPVDNVRDLLAMDVPEGRDEYGQLGWVRMTQRAREILKGPEAQDRFLRDLPTLTPVELVKLWDVFWLEDASRAQGFTAFGGDFGPKASQRLLDLILSRPKDDAARRLFVNLLLPDARFLSDVRLESLRQALASDADPGIRDAAQRLPKRW